MNIDKLIECKKKAEKNAQEMLRKRDLGEMLTQNELKEYIKNKFMLDDSDFDTTNILELAKRSIARQHNIELADIRFKDGYDCSGATSSMTKKILLIMAIEKDLNLYFSKEQSADITDISDIIKIAEKQWIKCDD